MSLWSAEKKPSNDAASHHQKRNYWRSYQLARDPFETLPNNQATFLFGKWEHHLDLVQHLIHTENTLLAVYGHNGCGKTTLMQQLLLQIAETMQVCSVNATPELNLPELIDIIQNGFKLSPHDSVLLEEMLDNQVAEMQFNQRICVLVIDQAEKLPEETIQALLYLLKQQSKTQMKFHAVLFGERELQTKLAKLAKQELSGELVHSIQIDPLTLEETRQYIQHRLKNAGLKGNNPFSPSKLDEIYETSAGNPEQINQIAAQTLIDLKQEKSMSDKPNFFNQNQTRFVGAGVLVAAIAIAVLFLNHQAKENNSLANNAKSAVQFNEQRTALAQPARNSATSYGNTVVANTVAANSVATNQPATDAATANPTLANNGSMVAPAQNQMAANNNYAASANAPTNVPQPAQVAANNAPAANSQAVTNQTVATQNQNNVAQPAASNMANTQNPVQNNNVNAAANAVNNAPAATTYNTQTAPANNTAATSAQSQSPSIQNAEQAVLNPQSQPQTTPAIAAPKAPQNNRQAVVTPSQPKTPAIHTVSNNQGNHIGSQPIMGMDSHHYTIQILALTTQGAVENYIDANHLNGNARTFTTKKNGQVYYVLIYGSYASASAAKAAQNNLPAAVQKNGSWVRSFAGIQNEIRQTQG